LAELMDQAQREPRLSRGAVIRLGLLFLAIFATVAFGAAAYVTERGIAASRDWVIHAYQVRSQLNDLQLEIARAHAGESAYLMTQDDSGLPYSREQSRLALQTLQDLRSLTKDSVAQQRLDQLVQLLRESALALDSPAPAKNRAGAQKHKRDALYQQRIDSLVRSMQDDQEADLEQRLHDWDYLFRRNILILSLAFLLVALMTAYIFRLLWAEIRSTRNTEMRVRENAKSYRLMSARILELQDSERRRIARELHDSVGQYLAGIKIGLSQIIYGGKIDPATVIHETIDLTDAAIQEVRTISHLLHPPLLEELGFLPAARWYLDEYGKRSRIKVSLEVNEPIERLSKEVEIALFRVLQESLTNVYRHASAKAIDVRIHWGKGKVTLIVADDGRGIPAEVLLRFHQGSAPGIGLAGMRERLAEFGGVINVESSGQGSVVQAIIPTIACTPKGNGSTRPNNLAAQ